MDLKQLEWFVRVAELGSFTRASATLDVSQSVLSRQVRALEIEMRQHLLYRNGGARHSPTRGRRSSRTPRASCIRSKSPGRS
jgi:LysR family nitrogen assimilation transcriptional regulator